MIDQAMIRAATFMLLKGLGVDPEDPNFRETPARVTRSYLETCEGLDNLESDIETILSTSFPSEGYYGMIFCTGIEVFSLCPHHLLPVHYGISLGYIPQKGGLVLGASKLPRLVEVLAKRPVLQEQLTNDIIDNLEQRIAPDGVAIVVSGSHYCMRMRGVKQRRSKFETSIMTGAFKDQAETRDEFFHLIGGSR